MDWTRYGFDNDLTAAEVEEIRRVVEQPRGTGHPLSGLAYALPIGLLSWAVIAAGVYAIWHR